MKNLRTFNEFLNEGLAAASFKSYPKGVGLKDAWDSSLHSVIPKIEKALGAKEKDIMQIDEYSAEDSPEIAKAYKILNKKYNATDKIDTEEHTLDYDAKLNVTMFQDQYDGFTAYQITKKSKI